MLGGWKGISTLNDVAARSIWFHSCNSWSLSKGRSRSGQRKIARRSSKKLRRQSSTLEVSATACYWPRAMGKTFYLSSNYKFCISHYRSLVKLPFSWVEHGSVLHESIIRPYHSASDRDSRAFSDLLCPQVNPLCQQVGNVHIAICHN